MSHTRDFAISVIKEILFNDVEQTSTKECERKIDEIVTQKISDLFQKLESNSLLNHIYVDNSTIPNSGKGVFVKGRINKGDVVCFYKGTIYSNQDLLVAQMVLNNNDYLMNHGDNFIIDGNFDAPLSVLAYQSCMQKVSVTEKFPIKENPLALGQFINHSPSKANLIPYEHVFKDNLPLQFKSYIPTVYFNSSSKAQGEISKTVVFLALRDIEDEELFFHYRFSSTKKNVPKWYLDSL